MKLLRLLADQETSPGAFEWQLADSIKLDPGSQVALQQCSLSLSPEDFEVDASNNKFTFKCAAAAASTPRQVTITQGSYTTLGLMQALEDAMNAAVTIGIQSNKGFQWRASIPGAQTTLAFNRVDENTYPPMRENGGTWAAPTLTNTAGVGWNCWATCTRGFIRSAGIWATTVAAAAYPCAGLSTSNTPTNGDPATMRMAVYVDTGTGTYWTVDDGTITNTLVAAVNGDRIGVQISQGVLTPVYVRGAGNGNITALGAGSAYDYTSSLWPIISLNGAAGLATALTPYTHDTDPFDLTASNADARPTSIVELLFQADGAEGAAQLLGFNQELYRSPQAAGASFVAPSNIQSRLSSLGLLVLLESLPSLHCYDSATGGKRPILASINAWQEKADDAERVDYMPSVPVFLDIGNDTPIFLSSFRIRIIDAANNPIQLSDGVAFTLLFK